jgi:hypothetical protein
MTWYKSSAIARSLLLVYVAHSAKHHHSSSIAEIVYFQVAKLAVSIVMYYCKFLGVDRAEVIKLLIAENAIIDSDAVRNTHSLAFS